jgi:hypothetical protein
LGPGARARLGADAAVGRLVLAACSGSSAPSPTPVSLGVSCPPAATVQTTLASAFAKDALVLSQSQGTGETADTLYCTYRASDGDDVAIQITVGSRAQQAFDNSVSVPPANQTVTVGPLQVAQNGWAATAPDPAGGGLEIVAAGAIQGETYPIVYYRYLAYPVASSSHRPAPTKDETVALLELTLGPS